MTPAFAVWITGLPASGKSTVTQALRRRLSALGVEAAVLESDALRQLLTPHPTYSDEERDSFYRSMTYIGALLVEHGVPVIFDATANRRVYRARARSAIARFVEVYVECPLATCIARDPKAIYRQARAGEASSVPGLQVAYEPPEHPDVVVAGNADPDDAAGIILKALQARGDVVDRATSLTS